MLRKINRRVLGLDIGVTSVGYGVIDLDTGEAVDYGVRLFDESNPKANQDRRSKRSGRRMKRRRYNRLRDMRILLEQENLIPHDYKFSLNPYEARTKGLHNKLKNEELATALYNLAKMRGNSLEVAEESTTADDESVKAALQSNDELLKTGLYVCEIQQKRLDENKKIRGHQNNFRTADYLKETSKILENQEVSEEFKKSVLELIARRRDFSDGPGSQKSPTPYGRWTEFGQLEPIDLIEKMRGKCSIYPDEMRAPKMSYQAELFNFLNDLNNLNFEGEKITPEQKEEIIKIIDEKGSITPKALAKFLQVPFDQLQGFRVNSSKTPLLTEFKGYKTLMKVLKPSRLYLDHDLCDQIIDELTRNKEIQRRKDNLRKLSDKLSEEEIDTLANLTNISGYHALSEKALRELNKELLETEYNQMQLLSVRPNAHARLEQYKGKKNITADDTAILSPIAKRAQREALKVVNRLRELHGEFDTIVIETTRAKNSDEEKKQEEERIKFFTSENNKAQKLLDDAKANVKLNGKLRLKLRLYEEQAGKTAYILRPIDLGLLISDPTAYEIDHIIPLSVSLDDSYSNKVLVTRYENQAKGNLTPVQAFRKGKFNNAALEDYIANVRNLKQQNGYMYEKKKNNLLYEEDLTKFDTMKDFINRNLVDTSYANRVVLNTLQDYFKANEIPTKVHTIRGKATHMFRQKVHLEKDRDDLTTGYAHHAVDALIIASLKKFPRIDYLLGKYRNEEFYNTETGEISPSITDDDFFDPKYIQFISKLMSLEKNVVKFSYKIDTKPNRQIADETIYSTRIYDGEEVVIKKYKNIYAPKELHIANDILAGKTDKYLMKRNSPETFDYLTDIVNYYADKYKTDTKVFNADKNEFKINPFSLYLDEHKEKIRKPSKKNNGPEITSMKYSDGKLGNHIDITNKYREYAPNNKRIVLQQISAYRTDFYYSKDNGYRFVTVRYANIRYENTKKKYVIDPEWYRKEKDKKKIADDFCFCCSMHHDELIRIDFGDGNGTLIWKFTATNNDRKSVIEIKPISYHEKKQIMKTISKNTVLIEKVAADVCGNLYTVKNQELKLEF